MATCEQCGTERPWLHEHHTKARIEGGTDADGLMMVCANCHEDLHGGPFGGILKGRLSASPEALRKRSEAMKELWRDPDWRARQIEAKRRSGAKRSKRPPREELERLYGEMNQEEIAARYGVAQATVSIWMGELGMRTRKEGSRGKPPFVVDELPGLLQKNGSVNATARELGIGQSTLRYWMGKFGIEFVQEAPDKEAMQAALRQCGTMSAAAEMMGMPRSTFAHWTERYELERSTPGLPSKEDVERAYVESGFRLAGMARILDVSYSTANRWIREHGIERRGKVGRPKKDCITGHLAESEKEVQ